MRNTIYRACMKHVAIYFAMISFLPCLGIGEEQTQPMVSPYYQLQFAQLSSEDQSWCGKVPPLDGLDVQAFSVLNQSPGGQRPFFSLDLSANAVARNLNFCTKEWAFCKAPADPPPRVSLTVLHEPALGVTTSLHFRDPGDMTNASSQTQALTVHPLLTAQVDLVNLLFPWPHDTGTELKLTIAPQLDLYGRFAGKDAQFQWPLQPSVEFHLCKCFSVVGQISVPLFTVGGRNPPPSFAVGILWHAINP